jgi:hypothetical protein
MGQGEVKVEHGASRTPRTVRGYTKKLFKGSNTQWTTLSRPRSFHRIERVAKDPALQSLTDTSTTTNAMFVDPGKDSK